LVTNLLGTLKGFQTSKLTPVGEAHLRSLRGAELGRIPAQLKIV